MYYNSKLDSNGYIHSIDMVYAEYFAKCSSNGVLEVIRQVHEKFPEQRYEEYLDRKPSSRYDFYLNNIVFGGAHIDIGKYRNFDKTTKSWDLFDMFQVRVNPNKYMNDLWFIELLSALLSVGTSGYLRKYDYAIDIPLSPDYVEVIGSRKEPGLFKGTRYFGQAGEHGYLKVYDKQKELQKKWKKECEHPLTRVEWTQKCVKAPSLDTVAVFDPTVLKTDYKALNDTDVAIVQMYLLLKENGIKYDLKLGRGKMDKLKEYILGSYIPLKFDLLDGLLVDIKKAFELGESLPQEELLLQDTNEELPFE